MNLEELYALWNSIDKKLLFSMIVLSAVLRHLKISKPWAMGIPGVLGSISGFLTSFYSAATPPDIFNAVLFTGAGSVFVGRASYAAMKKLLNFKGPEDEEEVEK